MNGCVHCSHKNLIALDYMIRCEGRLYPYRCEAHFREEFPDKTPELVPYRARETKRLTITQIAKYLGVSYSTVRKAVETNEIPYIRIIDSYTGERSRYFFDLDMIDDWIKGNLTGGEKNRFEYELEFVPID